MESRSEPQCRTGSIWRGLLITASILSCCIQPTSAQISVVPNPPYGEVNRDVTLYIQGFSGRALFYTWYRKAVAEPNRIARYTVESGVQVPADIREKVLPNGSLLIPDLTLNDTDTYHVTIINSEGDTIFGQRHLTVYEKPKEGSNDSTLSGGAIAGIVIGVLAGIALIGGLVYFLFFRKTGGASEHHLTEHKSSAPNDSQTFSDSSPKRTEEVSYASVNFNAQKPAAKVQYPQPMDTVYSEIKKQ